ncbi:MAG: single-stranded nucleic acid binding R3H domain-containing protein, spoIIIJ-associated protein [candidate division WS6 bacterium GW2011_GWC1_33_20]|uniref:Single-stranded nucleic acid binding R3H domain protein n=2 Tax=Candidatus Dojkabacteria TaxID=74243 RepID=A0A0G0CW91_9BACT|nr:MAG: single-stranded nucleic acid binding R3H domain-containing protein, spoIIIJ-associated protein [candidate division WS6 bacterium GW2011_GWE2_33_157]KKP44271.1 MAG: single-stranded nucleic acid binding R3H domain-containing protein, spoIIIJ-associated protein [candidate division WS6 bacterium GW2011_GWC1_33_20]KKP45864.1 MAG: single-stranded nucleic acid binding R3H domain-containing protein, spoIIIJ-associated protein [candidate division WS6 bacterium GW2011_GWF1_33_233]KKP55139.1 MAG: s
MENIVKKELDSLLSLIGIEAEYSLEIEDNEGVSYFKISFEGDKLGYLIGNHGKHLDSFQYVLSMILRKKLPENTDYRVVLDVCGYKKDRDSKLERFALQKADDARILGEPVDLPPMRASDRRVVHMTLQVFDDIKTESIGEGMDRHIQIIPTSEKDMNIIETPDDTAEESEEDSEE